MKRVPIIILLIFAVNEMLMANEDYFKAYSEFQKNAKAQYEDFRKSAIDTYADFLKSAWAWYNSAPKITLPKEKIVPPVIYENGDEEIAPKPVPYEDVLQVPEPMPEPIPVIEINEDSTLLYNSVIVVLYATEIRVRCPKDLVIDLKNPNGDKLAQSWLTLQENGIDLTVYDCLKARSIYGLCDWAYMQLCEHVGKTLYGETNEGVLVGAYIYAVSGYQMRLAMSGSGRLYMLVGCDYKIIDTGWYEIEGYSFYPRLCSEDSLIVCSASFEDEHPLSLVIDREQKFKNDESVPRKLTSSIGVEVSSTVNKNLINFFNEYPTAIYGDDFGTRWALYANTPMSDDTKRMIDSSLIKAIKGKDLQTSLNVILNFVQTAFEYEYDDKVWGDDRAFFSEETVYYPYADCEDRSILFARLVRDILGLDVVLVYYPGHLATAVCVPEYIRGDYLLFERKRYIVCDPTYIGAPIGVTMPEMNNETAKIIKLNK